MSYTITSAQYGDAGNTSAVIQTVESGAVVVSQQDTPALWQALLDWDALPGNSIAAYVAPNVAAEARAAAMAVLDRLDELGRLFRAEAELTRKALNKIQARCDLIVQGINGNTTYAALRTAASGIVPMGTYTKAEVIQLFKDEITGNA